MCAALALLLTSCGKQGDAIRDPVPDSVYTESSDNASEDSAEGAAEVQQAAEDAETEEEDLEARFKGLSLQSSYKRITDHNPVMTQRFGADPYALVYDGRVYLYMTADEHMYEADGSIKENNYSNIWKINVISSADLVNWTDHGSVYAASSKGQATWGGNSWAPAAAYKNIDGKDRFFLYFANSGNGIAVLSADSPVGPFTDPIGGPLISRQTPNCASVTWLFDPAVLVDNDGSAYIYVGGGVPSPDKASDPGTARVAKLGADMISLDGDPIPIEGVKWLFEDSGINRIGDTYYYSYCSNFSVTPEAEKEVGFGTGEIIVMKGDDPMGPFTTVGSVLKNPGSFFGMGGNNHHCMFEFKGEWYITYHARLLEEALKEGSGYRSTNVDKLKQDENGCPVATVATRGGVDQVGTFNPFEVVNATTMANNAGLTTKPYGEVAEKYGSGTMCLTEIKDGSWVCVLGADFGDGASEFSMTVAGKGSGAVRVSLDTLQGEVLGYLPIESAGEGETKLSVQLDKKPEGVHTLYLTFCGEGYDVIDWSFSK